MLSLQRSLLIHLLLCFIRKFKVFCIPYFASSVLDERILQPAKQKNYNFLSLSQIDQLQRDIREKDILIHQKTSKMKQISEDLAQKSHEISILRRSVENLREQVPNLLIGL